MEFCFLILPANMPDKNVANTGVLVLEFTLDNHLKSKPSFAIAYNIRGNGNIQPNKLVHNAQTAPTVTIHFIAGQPTCSNTYGNGASGF